MLSPQRSPSGDGDYKLDAVQFIMPEKILLLITVDRLPPTDLSCYGNRETEMPALDRLVAGGIVYDEHYSPASFARSSLKAWVNGQPCSLQQTDALSQGESELADELIASLRSQKIHASRIDCSETNYKDQIQQFFRCVRNSERSFCWLQLSISRESCLTEKATRMEKALAYLREKIEPFRNASVGWIITSELGYAEETATSGNFSALYASSLQQSLSRKLWRPLILSGNFLPEGFPQRIQSLTIAQDIHWTILDFLNCEITSDAKSRSLLAGLSDLQQQDRQLLLLDENLAGLRTATDLTVIGFDSEQESDQPSARYYLKPEDRNDVNDLQITAPDHVEVRVAALREFLEKM